jgi:8-oxo-dGTP pyrophosphatase MutT (NUDIX family)
MSKVIFPKGIEVVTTAFVIKGEQLLLARANKKSDIWVFPGGHVEPGEEILKSCEREVEEETGLKVKATEIFDYGEAILTKAHFIYFNVLCELEDNQKVIKQQGNDILDYDWFSIEEALELKTPDVFKDKAIVYKKYLDMKE